MKNLVSNNIKIRKAESSDFPKILELIKELATYEKAPEQVSNTVQKMEEDASIFKAVVAELDSMIVGMAIYFPYYSTWKGRCLYLEDIVVTEKHRKKGIGKMLFDAVVTEAKNFKAQRLAWQVLNWNTSAIDFYKKINAEIDSTWLNCRLTEKQIENYEI